MQDLARNGYSLQDVNDVLHYKYGTRDFRFRYERLSSINAFIDDLYNVLSCRIDYNALADVKRTASMTLLDDGSFNYLSDRIKPYIRLMMPDGGYVEWPQGVFLLTSPSRNAGRTGTVTRDVQAYDQNQVYLEDLVTTRTSALAGVQFTAKVTDLLGGTISKNLLASVKTFPVTKEWDPGTPKLSIINECLSAINYESLWFNEDGVAQIRPYQSPSERPPEHAYRDDETSVIFPEVLQDLDVFDVPNKWVLATSDPDRPLLTASYTNSNPSSTTSTVARGRTKTYVDYQVEAADQATLTAKAQRLAFEASQIYEAVEFTTGLMPFHSHADVYDLRFNPLVIANKYSEHTWSLQMDAKAPMSHRARRVVTI